MDTKAIIFNCKDSTRAELNAWLLSQGYSMPVEAETPADTTTETAATDTTTKTAETVQTELWTVELSPRKEIMC